MEKVEKQLTIVIYCMLIIMMLLGLIFGGMFWIFSLVSIDMFIVYLIMQLTLLYPEDMRTWSGLKNITWKKVWNSIKL